MGEVSIPASLWKGGAQAVIELINSFRPASLYGHVTILGSLAKKVEREGIDPRMDLKGIVTTGECLSANDRRLIGGTIGAPVYDRYGLVEVSGYVAQECERHTGLHVNGGLAFVEVLKDGEVCGPGEKGRLVVTNLHNYVMPFIRYDTGDLATVGNECSCARVFHVLERIEGRSADWVLTDSTPISWDPFLAPLYSQELPAVERFQFVQERIGEIALFIAPKSVLTAAEIDTLTKRLNSVHESVKVRVETVHSIEPTASGKHVAIKPLRKK